MMKGIAIYMEDSMKNLRTKLFRQGIYDREGKLLALEKEIDEEFGDLKENDMLRYWLGGNNLPLELKKHIDEFNALLEDKIKATNMLYRGESFDTKNGLLERLKGIKQDGIVSKSPDAEYYPKEHEDILAKRGDKTEYLEVTASYLRASYFSSRRDYSIIFYFDASKIDYSNLKYYGEGDKNIMGNVQFLNEEEVRSKKVHADAINEVSIYLPEHEKGYRKHIVFTGALENAISYLEAESNKKIKV
jgi:hypothetical protein